MHLNFYYTRQGIKVDFYKTAEDENSVPKYLGFTNILPLHLEKGAGSLVLAINSNSGFCLGHVTGLLISVDVSGLLEVNTQRLTFFMSI